MSKTKLILGSHTVANGGMHMAVLRAANAGMNAVQVFTAPPQYYGDKSNMKAERIERFQRTLEQAKMKPEHVLVHGAYVLSVATAEPDKWARAAAGLKKEMERSVALGVGQVCFHSGSASDGDPKAAAKRVARAMTEALEAVPGKTRLLVENTAGAGKTLGRTAEEVADILVEIPDSVRERAGYGLDTCHLFASGYDISESSMRFTAILDEFEEASGEAPSFFHLNDSEGALGSNRDRHMLIGEGLIGAEPFRWLMNEKRAKGTLLILETPQQNMDVADEDPAGDPFDVRMYELLTSFMK